GRRRRRGDPRPARHVRRRQRRRHLRLRRAGPLGPAPGTVQPPLRRMVRRGRRRTGGRAGGAGPPPGQRHREDGRRPGRTHLPHRARAPRAGREDPARRPGPALRTVHRGQRRALPQRQGPRAARRLPPALDHPQPGDPPGGQRARQRPAHPVAVLGLSDERLARARDVRLLRHRLRRSPGPDADHDAGRLAGPPAAQGLPPRRPPRRVQGRPDPGSGPAEVVLMSTHTPSSASARETTEGTVYTVTGGDWDEVVEAAARADDERIVVNMGPQHPSTHGVLRLILEIDGETVTEARAGIGYLHTGIEKNLEYRTWTQGTTFVTRMDYLTPFFNETAYCLAVEKLLGIEDQVPDRASVIRVLLMELNRLSSHLVAIATGGMELGATTIMIYGFRDRELVLDVFELITGLRMNHAYIRPGGLAQDLPPGAVDQIRECVKTMRKNLPEYDALATGNPIFKARLQDVGYLDLAGCMALGATGPVLRSTGLPHDLRKAQPYCGYETYDFEVPTADTCDSYGLFLIRLEEMRQSLNIIEQCLDRLQPGPVMVADKRIAWPAQLALGTDGLGNSPVHIKQIMGTSMDALIHHFRLVTVGFRVPPGQAYTA